MEKDAIIQEAIKIIRRHLPQEYQIMLFGSWARGDALATSDIDVGILGKKKVPRSVMAKIVAEVENLPTLRSVDVVDLNTKETNFRQEALRYAKTLA